jgi:hypothetical protein
MTPSLNCKMEAPIVLSVSVHWLTRQVFVLLLALSVGASGTGQAFLIPTSGPDMTPTMRMNMAMDMPMDKIDAGLLGSQQGVPCKDMQLNCADGLGCIMCGSARDSVRGSPGRTVRATRPAA